MRKEKEHGSDMESAAEVFETLGYDEEPMGILYSNEKPAKDSRRPPRSSHAKKRSEPADQLQAVSAISPVSSPYLAGKKKKRPAFSIEPLRLPGGLSSWVS